MDGSTSSCSCGAKEKNRIIYSSPGIGSNAGQLSNAAACRLTNEGYGGGSCLAGVGGVLRNWSVWVKGQTSGCH